MGLRMRVVVVFVCLLVTSILAQAGRGRVTGVITDPAGAVLPGVTVTLAGVEQRRAVTNERGEFTFENLVPGRYTLRATLPGLVDLMRDVSVADRGAVRLTLQMAAGALEERVAVSAQAPAAAAPPVQRRSESAVAGGLYPVAPPAALYSIAPAPDYNTEAYDHIEEPAAPRRERSRSRRSRSTSTPRRTPTSGASSTDGQLPPPDAVRIEELINYFRYDYPQPRRRRAVRRHHGARRLPVEPEASPGADRHQGARDRRQASRAPRNLVFLLDVSGSMTTPDKLPLVRKRDADARRRARRAATAWRSSSTPARAGWCCRRRRAIRRTIIHARIAQLEAGGSTNGGAGIQLAYRDGARALHQRRRQPRDPRHRRRLQRRRHQPGRARAADRRGARERRLPVGARLRHRQPQGRDDGEARRQGQRQLRLPRLAARSAQGARARSRRHARRRSPRT